MKKIAIVTIVLQLTLTPSASMAGISETCSRYMYQISQSAIDLFTRNREKTTHLIKIDNKSKRIKVALGEKISSGYRGSVYHLDSLEVQNINGQRLAVATVGSSQRGQYVFKVPHALFFRQADLKVANAELEREVLSLKSLSEYLPQVEQHSQFPKDPYWKKGRLPVVPIVQSFDSSFGTLIVKPFIKGRSLNSLIHSSDFTSEMHLALEEAYALTRSIGEVVPYTKIAGEVVTTHTQFHIDINGNNLVWVDSPAQLEMIGMSRPGWAFYEMTPLQNRLPQYLDINEIRKLDRQVEDLGLEANQVRNIDSVSNAFEWTQKWLQRYYKATFFKGRIPKFATPQSWIDTVSDVSLSEVRFMQAGADNAMQAQKGVDTTYTVLQTAIDLKTKKITADVLPVIEAWKDDQGRIWSLDHRRLCSMKLAGNVETVKVKWVSQALVEHDHFKFSTTTEGKELVVDLGDNRGVVVR